MHTQESAATINFNVDTCIWWMPRSPITLSHPKHVMGYCWFNTSCLRLFSEPVLGFEYPVEKDRLSWRSCLVMAVRCTNTESYWDLIDTKQNKQTKKTHKKETDTL